MSTGEGKTGAAGQAGGLGGLGQGVVLGADAHHKRPQDAGTVTAADVHAGTAPQVLHSKTVGTPFQHHDTRKNGEQGGAGGPGRK